MAIKTKNSDTPAQACASPVEKAFSEGLELLNAGDLAKASAVFESVLAQAMEQEHLSLGRTVRGYLAAIQARRDASKEWAPASSEMAAQILLNQQDSTGAQAIIEKAILENPERGIFHYLKAVALAQQEQAEASAEALAKAVELDPDFLYQFRLESDFDGLRQQAAFTALLKA